MKRILLRTLLLVFALAGSSASAEVLTRATVVQGNLSAGYTMYGTGKMYFEDGRLVIDTIGGGPVVRYDLDSIDKLLLSNFEPSVSGVGNVAANIMAVAPTMAKEEISVTGINAGFAYRVFDAAGRFVAQGESSEGQPISVDAFEKGVYFIQINGNVLKFVKL